MIKILFIANPKSDIIDKADIGSIISAFAGKYNFSWELHYTEQYDTSARIREIIREYNPDLVVAAGGDGTVNQVASELINSNISLGIIPAGSANGLAYNLGIPSGVNEALQFILDCKAKPVDVIQLNNQIYCFHLSDIGINARIVSRFEKEGSKGLCGYAKQMLKELSAKRRAFSFNLETPAESKRYKAEMLVIANAKYYGTGAIINPVGQIDDGEFEIIIIRPYPWWILFYLVRMFLFGTLEKLKYVKVIKTTQAEINLDKPDDLQADGEIFKDIKSMKIKILPSALKIRYK
jgi:diacylglycerol kinase (ATP)